MFRIFYDSLVRPRNIVDHVECKKSKFIGFFALLIILLVIPYFLEFGKAISYTTSEAKKMASFILKEDPIEYAIKDGKLIYTGSGEDSVRYVKLSVGKEEKENIVNESIGLFEGPVYLVFSLDGLGYEVNEENAHIILFKENGIDIMYRPYKKVSGAVGLSVLDKEKTEEEVLKTISYEDLEIDFNYNNGYKKNYYLKIYNVGNLIYQSMKWELILEGALFSIIMNVIAFLVNIFFTVLFVRLLFRFKGLKFFRVVKIAILCSTIFVVGDVLAYLYNLTIISFIGEVLSLVYTYRVMRQYSILKFSNMTGGN